MAERKLNPKQEKFCQLYASDREFFGNGVQSYIEAYEPQQIKPNWYATARTDASKLLTNSNVLARINELLDITFNDQHVDKQLALVVTQNADFSSKVAAIREYNRLKSRVEEGLKLPKKGKGEVTYKWDDGSNTSIQTTPVVADTSQQQ